MNIISRDMMSTGDCSTFPFLFDIRRWAISAITIRDLYTIFWMRSLIYDMPHFVFGTFQKLSQQIRKNSTVRTEFPYEFQRFFLQLHFSTQLSERTDESIQLIERHPPITESRINWHQIRHENQFLSHYPSYYTLLKKKKANTRWR